MKFVVLSKLPRAFSTKRLAHEARARGHVCLVADPDDFALLVDREGPVVYYKTRRIREVDIVVPRLGMNLTDFTLSLVSAFETLDVACLNGYTAIVDARDKFRSLNVLSRHGVLVPRTALARRPEDLEKKVALVGGPPVIMKLAQKVVQGAQGLGVIVAENIESITSILESFWEVGKNILLQQYVSESRGRDTRVYVVGGRALAALWRQTRFGELRSHLRRPSTLPSVAVEPTRAYRDIALRAAGVLGLRVACVDVIESRDGPMVIGVNASPGFEEVERASSRNLAGEVVRYGEVLVAERRATAKAMTRLAAPRPPAPVRSGRRKKRAAVSVR